MTKAFPEILKAITVTQRPVVSCVTLELPMPPSTNALTFNRPGGRAKTARYRAWIAEAGCVLIRQRPGRIAGHYVLTAAFCRADKASDLSNRVKALEDLLVRHGVIEDDKLADEIHLRWSTTTAGVLVGVAPV